MELRPHHRNGMHHTQEESSPWLPNHSSMSSPVSRALPDKAAQIGSRTGESLKIMAYALPFLQMMLAPYSSGWAVSPGNSRAELTSVMVQARRHATASPRCNPHSPYTALRSFRVLMNEVTFHF
ncbi:hypothetical protein B0H12DRAFT_1143484 [Mycena haematopus]|nr:hypothetical protein B0H12DRAFT_1143484 [Mycena haematopus]